MVKRNIGVLKKGEGDGFPYKEFSNYELNNHGDTYFLIANTPHAMIKCSVNMNGETVIMESSSLRDLSR